MMRRRPPRDLAARHARAALAEHARLQSAATEAWERAWLVLSSVIVHGDFPASEAAQVLAAELVEWRQTQRQVAA